MAIQGANVNQMINRIIQDIHDINNKLDLLISIQKEGKPGLSGGLDVMTLLKLPDHLRTTAMILYRCSEATADEVAEKTNKERAVESNYLNQLEKLGHVEKIRKGRKVYFRIK